MKMLAVAQNPGGGTISAQEFATARQDLTNLLQNTVGYVPEQVATINERVRVSAADAAQLQRQRQRERIARQQRFAQAPNLTGVLSAAPDPGLGSVAFGLGSDERNALTDFADGQGLYSTGEPLQAAVAAAEDQLYEPLTDQPDVETEEVFETPGYQGQVEEPDTPVDFGTPEQRQQQLQRFRTIFDIAGQLDADIGISTVDLQGTIAERTPSQQQLQGMSATALTDMNNQILTQLGQIIEQPDVRPYVNATTQLEIRKNFPGLLEPVGVRAGAQADITGDTRKRERDPTVRDAGPPKFEMRTISASDVGEQRQNRKILADREFRRQEAMQTMTGQESLGASTRGQFSFDPEPRKRADKFSTVMWSDSSDSGDGQEREQQLRNAGRGKYNF
eukprot:COSAG01_NODE_12825_length_1680_cov_2.804554_2_plen_391_part_00